MASRDNMKTYKRLHVKICDIENIRKAYRKARKGKSSRSYVKDFDLMLEINLLTLKEELENLTYTPKPMKTFVAKDPKTRVITAPHFRDRIVHHAICNVLEPIFDRGFIYDSYACRKGKGTHSAIQRLDEFKRIVSCNGRRLRRANDGNMVTGFVLKCDIKQYFVSIDHEILKGLIERKIKDKDTMRLIDKVLACYRSDIAGKGIPIGSLTSQLFANIYLNPLDNFVKHRIKAEHYIRYMDDFLIMHKSMPALVGWKRDISDFLKTLKIELHGEKSRIFPLSKGICFLGYRTFYHHRLLRKNVAMPERKTPLCMDQCDSAFERQMLERLEGWLVYASHADTYKLRRSMREKFSHYPGALRVGPSHLWPS